MTEPTLRRGFLGYSRKSVEQLLSERELAVAKASEEARTAAARVTALQGEIGRLRREAAERAQALETTSQPEEPTTPTTEEGLGQILEATERALADLFRDADKTAETKLRDIERTRDGLQEDVERLEAWRHRMIGLTDAVRKSIEDARVQATSASDRLREAVTPATNAMEALARRLDELAETSEPPELGARPAPEAVIRLEEAEPEPADDSGEAAARTPAPDQARPDVE